MGSAISDSTRHAGFARRRLAFGVAVICLMVGAMEGCGTLPSLDKRSSTVAFADTRDTRLGRAVGPKADAHPGQSGIHPLSDARDAFAARAHLAAAAERSLDVQYYIWRKDMTGTLLFDALRRAADRGVRVRLLLDDNNTTELDTVLAALDAHPNIEVRLFNPFVIRHPRWIGYLTDFSRLNRRMHNKSFTADDQVTIIGGRNVGDEYFGAADDMLFADLDVMAVGPVVRDVSNDFDRYWASASSYPADRLLPPAQPALVAHLAEDVTTLENGPAALRYLNALRDSTFVQELMQGRLSLEWAPTRMISDDPAKGLGLAGPQARMPEKIKRAVGTPAFQVNLVSPYFVPTAAGVDALTAMARRGVRIRVLTNSLEATDVAAVHAGYAKRRKALLEAGITLYELRRLSPVSETAARRSRTGSSSASSLHAKTFSVDGEHVFIGSFNFDPRSAQLNTEMGFVIESPALAQQIEARLGRRIPTAAYQVQLSKSGQLTWIERREDGLIRHDTEPGTTFWQRAAVRFLSVLPIEWLL
ncbi:phospholipase D family protein [Oxalobacteraceae bacterium OM1]|nr:phospholipase D family protein [Oxalobacteraceae bacterium OM1]